MMRKESAPICMAAGFFDGVHRGHIRILNQAASLAGRLHGKAWALTFDSHPLNTLKPSRSPEMLTSLPHKLRLLKQAGMDGCLVLRFNRRLANMDPLAFLGFLFDSVPTLRHIVVGHDWRFGKSGAGDAVMLKREAAKRGIRVRVVRHLEKNGKSISSTRIRECVMHGRLDEAAAMLGRPFSIRGTVERGRRIGRKLGFPTANLDPHNEARPPNGVYAAKADVGKHRLLPGVVNIGTNPTFTRRNPARIELHIPGYNGNLYGREIEVFFLRKLRNERRFTSPAALARRIAVDIRMALAVDE